MQWISNLVWGEEDEEEEVEEKKLDSLLQVRAVTTFIVLTKDSTSWEQKITAAANFDARVAAKLTDEGGYIVQTLRIVTNPFGEYLDTSTKDSALADMEKLKNILSGSTMPKIRIRFAIGAATSQEDLQMVPALIQSYGDLANVCVNITADELGVPDRAMCAAAATCVRELAENTPRGQGNFNFTANFNCPPLIPYFPAGYNTDKNVFCIGLEYPDLLVDILSKQPTPLDWSTVFPILQKEVQQRVDTVVALAERCNGDFEFAGIDSSPAPRKDIHSMVEVFKGLGVNFGEGGTLQACSYLTRLFKSIKNVQLIGFSGLMLTCLEDKGMAAAAAAGCYNITMLNAYSAVCGIGLDCVPVPGDTPTNKIEALMGDTGTLAFRLNKPLTVRLFPCPGLKAGDTTKFTSADLCNCTVFDV